MSRLLTALALLATLLATLYCVAGRSSTGAERVNAVRANEALQRVDLLERTLEKREREKRALMDQVARLSDELEAERIEREKARLNPPSPAPEETDDHSSPREKSTVLLPNGTDLQLDLRAAQRQAQDESAQRAQEMDKLAMKDGHVELRGQQVTDADLQELANRPDLSSLNLRGSTITDEQLVYLQGMTQLDHLDLRGTHITDASLHQMPPYLQSLHLTDTKVHGYALDALPALPHLKRLKLNRTAFGDQDVHTLGRFPGIKHLEVDGTRLTDQGLEEVMHLLPNLKRIELRRAQWTQEGLARLREQYPYCEIVWQ